MAASLEETLISVWRQAIVEGTKTVTRKAGIFPCEGRAGPNCAKWIFVLTVTNCADSSKILKTSSRLAREGKKVMQFLSERRYIAVVVDGKVRFYGKAVLKELERQV